jgi:hypothetical protein
VPGAAPPELIPHRLTNLSPNAGSRAHAMPGPRPLANRHSIAVLLKVYAKCINSQGQIAKQRIEDALHDPGKPGEDTPHEPEEEG